MLDHHEEKAECFLRISLEKTFWYKNNLSHDQSWNHTQLAKVDLRHWWSHSVHRRLQQSTRKKFHDCGPQRLFMGTEWEAPSHYHAPIDRHLRVHVDQGDFLRPSSSMAPRWRNWLFHQGYCDCNQQPSHLHQLLGSFQPHAKIRRWIEPDGILSTQVGWRIGQWWQGSKATAPHWEEATVAEQWLPKWRELEMIKREPPYSRPPILSLIKFLTLYFIR